MKGYLSAGIAIAILVAIGIYSAFPHPTYDQTELKALAAESQQLISTNPLNGAGQSVDVPKDNWPPVIASLKPVSVHVHYKMVDITTHHGFDGGWGYGFTTDKQHLTMLVECWSDLGHGVYWHGPC